MRSSRPRFEGRPTDPFMKCPRISVLMPVYNVEDYVHESVDSVIGQSFDDFEMVIVDDCSDDRTGEILESCARHDSRIRIERNEKNLGHTKSLVRGLALTRGEFLARMDGDDISMPERFARQLSYMNTHPECVAVGGQVLFVDEDGDTLCPFARPLRHEDIEQKLWVGDGLALVHPTVMMRREAVLAAGGYREDLPTGEDLDLYLRLAECGKLANLPDVLLKFRRHFSSATALGDGVTANRRVLSILQEAAERRGLEPGKIRLGDFPQSATRGEWHAEWARRVRKRGGNRRVARKHTLRAVRHSPCSRKAWRALVYVFAGR